MTILGTRRYIWHSIRWKDEHEFCVNILLHSLMTLYIKKHKKR